MDEFKYAELPSQDHIRIIELLPGAKDDTIQCNLNLKLREDTKNNYDAISYAWGNRYDTIKIICCGKIMTITTSLADALRTIRSQEPGTSRPLWADAICINQESSEEKSHQVRRIAQVYENARQVLVWLGPDEDGIALDCFNLLIQWNEYLNEKLVKYKHHRNIPSIEPPPHICDESAMGSKLRRLMSLDWFSRVWVVQEAGLAKQCHLLWGDQSMSIAELIEFACFCDGRSYVTQLMGGNDLALVLWRIIFICVYRTYNNENSWRCSKPLIRSIHQKPFDGPGLFLDILQIGKSLSATVARDHIYAFLGNRLASNEGKLILEPDYKKDEGEVYYDTACALLKSRIESPYVLSFVQHSSADEVTGSNGPSWIPRWNKIEKGPALFYTIGNVGLSHKAGGPVDRLQYRVDGGLGAQRLTLQGFEFDHLTWTSELLKTENFSLNPSQWDTELRTSQHAYIEVLWTSVPSVFKRHRGGPTEPLEYARYDDEFSYALVTGYTNSRMVNSREHRRKFKAYLHALQKACNPEQRTSAALSPKQKRCDTSRYEAETHNCSNRRLAVTNLGHFALVPQFAQAGDVCCVFLGMATPFVLRPAIVRNGDRGKAHHLVGEAYIHGVMGGEGVAALDRGEYEKKDITLM